MPAPVLADRAQLEQVLLGLAMNAHQAMPDGGRLGIAVAVEAGADGGPGSVTLTMSDTGVGMDEATAAKAFDPFFTTKPPGSGTGTGLGLATVSAIIAVAGGDIRLHSTPGEGTNVIVRLPALSGSLLQSADPGRGCRALPSRPRVASLSSTMRTR